MLQVFGLIPEVRTLVFAASWLWMFAAMVVAVCHALDLTSLARAMFVCVVALAVVLGTVFVVGLAVQRVVS